jgi:hypothetical protein
MPGSRAPKLSFLRKLVAFIRHLPKLTSIEETEMEALNPKTPD